MSSAYMEIPHAMNTATNAIQQDLEIGQLQQLSMLFSEVPEKIYYKNTALEYVWANTAYLHSLNLQTLDQLNGKQDKDFFPDSVVSAMQNDERRVISHNERVVNKAMQLPALSTKSNWHRTSIVPVYNAEKSVVGILCLLCEIPAERQTTTSEKDLINNLLNYSQDSIYFKDRESKFICTNQQYALKLGVQNPEELTGKSELDYTSEIQARAIHAVEQEVLHSGQPLLGKIDKQTFSDGSETWVQNSISPLKDGDGTIIGTFTISQDITAQKQAETELELINQKLLSISKQADMSEVANNILHNVGNVLNSVNISASTATTIVKSLRIQSIKKTAELLEKNINKADFLSKDEKGKQVPAFLYQLAGKLNSDQETAISELNCLTDYINHIKEVLNMQQTNFKNSDISEKIKLSRLIEKAVNINRGSLTRHEIKVTTDIINDIEILVDKHKALQILVNLIRNAKQACDDSNQREKKVNINANHSDDNNVYIEVVDNGIGMSEETAEKIFAHGFTTKKDGNGFGLHSCLNLATELGGSLSVHSDGPGKGSAFRLTLPKKPSDV